MIFENIKFLSHRLETIGVVLSWGAAVLAVLLYVLRPWLLDALRRYIHTGRTGTGTERPRRGQEMYISPVSCPYCFRYQDEVKGCVWADCKHPSLHKH